MDDRNLSTSGRKEIGGQPKPAGERTPTDSQTYGAQPNGPGTGQAPWDDHLTEASTELARVFGEIFDANDQRHRQAAAAINRLDEKQQNMARVTDTILNNQKDSVQCYRELMDVLARIREAQNELKAICQQNHNGYAELRKLFLIGSAVQLGVLVLAGGALVVVLGIG
mgnify:CR=1 FL=1